MLFKDPQQSHIYQTSLSEVGQGFSNIIDDGDQALYLGLALFFKTKVTCTMKAFQDKNFSNNQTCI